MKRTTLGEMFLTKQHRRRLDGILSKGARGRAGTQRKKQREVEPLEILLLTNVAGYARDLKARNVRNARRI